MERNRLASRISDVIDRLALARHNLLGTGGMKQCDEIAIDQIHVCVNLLIAIREAGITESSEVVE